MKNWTRLLAATALAWATLLPSATALAATAPDTRALWRSMTEADLEAAYRLIADNHPGSVPALNDQDFQRRLAEGHALARKRAASVETYGGYAGVMTGFAGAFGDDHIAFRPLLAPARVRWAGIMVTLKGEAYVVSDLDPAEAKTLSVGDTLVGCDSAPAAAVAEHRLAGFRGDWSSAARRYLVAPYLLLDADNPFAPPPKACAFQHQGRPVETTLRWRDIANADATARVRKAAPVGQAGMGLRTFAGGYWIGLQRLDPEAAKVVAAVKTQQDAIRQARLVVVDLRGNVGGASLWGDQLALAIWGGEYFRSRLASQSSEAGPRCDSGYWRATPDNLKTIQFYKANPERFGPSFIFEGLERQVGAAIAGRRPLSGDYQACLSATSAAQARPAQPAAAAPASPLRGQVLVLTDATCFSSCLITLNKLLTLGAVQAGQASSAMSRYMEVRDMPLPSGLGTFSTLQAADLAAPAKTGPFAPAKLYSGDISDTAALEAWAAGDL